MSLRINQNVLSISTYGSLSQTSERLEKSVAKLSSGLRINTAADDAAGLAISEKMRRQIRGLSRATLNAQDGISMIQTAEGALNETHSILQRMRELAIQSSNDTLTSGDRLEIQKEVVQLKDDINRISRNTEFNTKKLLDGSQTALISSSSDAIKGLVNGPIQGGSGDYDVSISLLKSGMSQMQTSQIFAVKDGYGQLADGGTQLQSLSQFYDANGVFVLDTPQALVVNGNGESTSVQLDGQMTLDNLAAGIQNAMISDSGLGIENSRIAMVNTIQTQVAGLGGYLELTSGYIGETGQVSFSGDQKIIDALGLAVSREATNSRVHMQTKDGFGNVRTIKTETDRGVGLLNGIDIQFDSQSAQKAGTSGLEAGLKVNAPETFNVDAGTVGVTALTIASGEWTMEGLARNFNDQINSASANYIQGLNASVVEGEIRFSYDKPATVGNTVGTEIEISGAGNSTVGFVNGTYSGFVDGSKSEDDIVWGFSQFVDGPAQNIELNISDGINNAVISIMTTLGGAANDEQIADMKSFTVFQASANIEFKNLSVAIRVDQIGGAMAFTSTRVGTENVDGAAAITSMVSMTIAAADETLMNSRFGLTAGTVKGFGDTNFRMHIVDNAPQFHIGADQGQTMKVTMGNMSAEALDVDDLDLTNVKGAGAAIAKLNKAIDTVSSERAKLGSYQNRLEHSINNLRNTHSNLTSAESRIRDADIALEMIEFTRNQIVSQSATAMLAQANAVPQGVLQLLQ